MDKPTQASDCIDQDPNNANPEAEAPGFAGDSPWEPKPIPAEKFHVLGERANVNRAPYDQISGVIYKRAANIKRVRYEPLDAAPDMPEPWQGHGAAVVRWLFSERFGSEEQLLEQATFMFLHDVRLPPDTATGQRPHPGETHLLYVITGNGTLHHRPDSGSPVIARPLRPGDAALIHPDELYDVCTGASEALHLIVLGLHQAGQL